MKFRISNLDPSCFTGARALGVRGFTIMEVLISTFFTAILITVVLGSISAMQLSTSRTRDYNSAMAILEAKANDIRAVYYNPPVYPFTTTNITITNQYVVELNEAGTSFLIPGTLVTKIQYCGSMGHLITVTGSFQSLGGSLKAGSLQLSLQSFVNKYSGGRGGQK